MKKLTHGEFIDRLSNVNKNIAVIGNYTGMTNQIECKCNNCGDIWFPRCYDLLNGRSCPRCSGVKKKTQEEFESELFDTNPDLVVTSEYLGVNKRVTCKCNICGYEFDAIAKNLLSGKTKCRGCYLSSLKGRGMKTHQRFLSDLFSVNRDIDVRSKYNGVANKVDCRCKICGHEWSAEANALLKGEGCPICRTSHGERMIANYLRDHNISFEYQKSYEGLLGINGGLLSYDFYIGSINTLIEYQGEFHSGKVKRSFQSEKDFAKQKEHDKRKAEYAKMNNINLYEIWYYDDITDKLNMLFRKEGENAR